MGAKKQTIGYHYLMTLLFGLCRGPVNEIHEIVVGDKTALGGNLCSPVPGTINQPHLFGGEEKEGGVQGAYRLYMGEPDQVLDGETIVPISGQGPVTAGKLHDLRNMLAGKVSMLRGIVTFHFNGLIASMNPYPKEWAFRVRRTTAGWASGFAWYGAKATIWLADGKICAMNGAHIIYQLLTDPDFGAGEDPEEINEPSFIAAANVLCNERFGLCFKWERKDDVDKFIKTVLDHIGAAFFQDRETGLYTLKLIRGDYVKEDLPLFTPDSGLIEIVEDDNEASADAINEVIVTGKNPLDRGNDIQVRVQNNAGIQATGGKVSSPASYPGIPTAELLTRVGQRDLKAASLGLKRFTVLLDRRAWRVYPGMPFRISHPKKGIADIVVRIGSYDDRDDMGDGNIKLKVVEDVFSMPDTAFVPPVDGEWEGPSQVALPALEERLIEASYRDVYVARGAAEADSLTDTDALIGQLGASPNVSNRDYQLWSAVDPDPLQNQTVGFFTDYGQLVDPLGPYDTTMVLTDRTAGFDPYDTVGQALLIGDEIVGVVSYDPIEDEFTIARGAADTIPQAHEAGERAWTIDDDIATDGVLYQTGETVNTKVLSRTSSDVLDLDEADLQTITLVGRQARPYPPADLKVDDVLAFDLAGQHGEPVFTWAHRDRKLQADALLDTREASVGPEPGTTYTIRIYKASDDTLLRTVNGIDDITFTYDSTMQLADGSPNRVRVEVESSRDGLASYQKYDFYITINGGYGYGYGLNYGGA